MEYGDAECPFCGDGDGRRRASCGSATATGCSTSSAICRSRTATRSARLAAEAIEAAGAQGRFWEMHDRLFAEQDRLKLDDLVGHAQALGMDAERFLEALRDDVHEAAIDADIDSAERSGVTGTPDVLRERSGAIRPEHAAALAEVLDRVAG